MTFIPNLWKRGSTTKIKVGSLYKLKEVTIFSYSLHNGDNSVVAPEIKQDDIVLCVLKHVLHMYFSCNLWISKCEINIFIVYFINDQ